MKQLKNNALVWTGVHFIGISWVIAGLVSVIEWYVPVIIGIIFFLTSEIMLRKLAKKVKEAFRKE